MFQKTSCFVKWKIYEENLILLQIHTGSYTLSHFMMFKKKEMKKSLRVSETSHQSAFHTKMFFQVSFSFFSFLCKVFFYVHSQSPNLCPSSSLFTFCTYNNLRYLIKRTIVETFPSFRYVKHQKNVIMERQKWRNTPPLYTKIFTCSQYY